MSRALRKRDRYEPSAAELKDAWDSRNVLGVDGSVEKMNELLNKFAEDELSSQKFLRCDMAVRELGLRCERGKSIVTGVRRVCSMRKALTNAEKSAFITISAKPVPAICPKKLRTTCTRQVQSI